jgi:hypothetical protein
MSLEMMERLAALDSRLTIEEGGELPPPIPEEEQEQLVKKLKYEYDRFKNAVAPLHKKIDENHELYEAAPKKEKKFPWPGASNFTVPLIMSTIDSIHARIVKAVFEVDPLWLAKARTPQAASIAKKAEWYLDYWADEMDIAGVLDAVILSMLIEGVGILKVDWVRVTRPIPLSAGGGPERVIEYEGPSGRHVPLKDFVLIPADAPTIEDAVYVGHRVFLTRQQLQQRGEQGIYFNVSKLLEKSDGDSTTDRTPHPSNLLAVSSSAGEYEETHQFEIVEMYGPYDFGDGLTPALMTFSPTQSILLRLEPYPYRYGRAPYIDFKIFPRANFFWARSVPEILKSAQEELTALHNLRADAIARRLAPPLLRRFGSRWDPEEKPWQPGQVIDVNDPAEIIELSMQDVPSSLFAHERDTLAFVERVTGMSDYFMGRSPTQYRTATEINRVTSEGLARMDVSVSRFQKSMKKLAWVLWWLLYQYRPYVDLFHAENQDMMITKDEMRPGVAGLMPFEFIPQGQLSDASRDARRQQLLMLLQLSAGPLSQFYPDGLHRLLGEIYDEYDIKNHAEILGPEWGVLKQQLQMAFQQGAQQAAQMAAQQGSG